MRFWFVIWWCLLLTGCGEPHPPLKSYTFNGVSWGLTGYWVNASTEDRHVILILRHPDDASPQPDPVAVAALCTQILADPPSLPNLPPHVPKNAYVKLSKESRFLIFSSVSTIVFANAVDEGRCSPNPSDKVPLPAMLK